MKGANMSIISVLPSRDLIDAHIYVAHLTDAAPNALDLPMPSDTVAFVIARNIEQAVNLATQLWCFEQYVVVHELTPSPETFRVTQLYPPLGTPYEHVRHGIARKVTAVAAERLARDIAKATQPRDEAPFSHADDLK